VVIPVLYYLWRRREVAAAPIAKSEAT